MPPNIHRSNAAERAIRTFKKHFKAILGAVDPKFPLHLWCRLLHQAEMTLNMLRPCRLNPKMSAYMAINGTFNFDAMPLAPLGTHITFHETANQRGTWALNGTKAWYIGPAMEHYRCYRCFIVKTKAERIGDTIEWHTKNTTMPFVSQKDQAVQTAKDLTAVLNNKQTTAIFEPPGDEQLKAIKRLAEIFETMVTKDTSPRVPKRDTAQQRRNALPRVDADVSTQSQYTTTEAPNITSKPTMIPVMQHKTRTKLPPPRPHPIAVPTKANPSATHIIPFEEDECGPTHRYPTRYKHQAQCLGTFTKQNITTIFDNIGKQEDIQHLANPIIDDNTGQELEY